VLPGPQARALRATPLLAGPATPDIQLTLELLGEK
jgi:hypothetical protein